MSDSGSKCSIVYTQLDVPCIVLDADCLVRELCLNIWE